MRVDISDIVKVKGASLDISFNGEIQGIDKEIGDFSFNDPVEFHGRLTNMGGMLRLKGRMQTRYSGKCYRCLKDVAASMDIPITESFVEVGKKKDNDDETYTYQGDFIELDKVFIDNIILNLPMRLLCSNDCEGFVPPDGEADGEQDSQEQDKLIDPRLEVLKKFFNN